MQRPRDLRAAGEQALAAARGREHRHDEVRPGTGGPAGNARLTALTGLVLLVLLLAELVTLLDVRGLVSWHLALGVALIPPAVVKTGTTGWRIVRYYVGDAPYREAGPPPLVLRVLGPLVVLGTLGLLATGVALVWVGEADSRRALLTVLGFRVDVLTLHQGAFVGWAVVTGLHVLGRLVPAWQLALGAGRPVVPGRARRGLVLVASAALAVALGGWVLASSGGWRDGGSGRSPYGAHAGH